MNLDDDGNPLVLLGGKTWSIPQLAARQNKIIDPLIISLMPVFAEGQKDKTSAAMKLTETHYDALFEIAFQAIRKASPDTTRDQFLDLPITLPELMDAFYIIAQQTGIFVRGKASGEAPGGGSPPTGTPSLPESAT